MRCAKPYPGELCDDVVRVARNRVQGQHLKNIAASWGVRVVPDHNWLKSADVESYFKQPGTTAAENADLTGVRKPNPAAALGDGRTTPARGWSRGACREPIVKRRHRALSPVAV